MSEPLSIHWSSRVRPEAIARLYALDATGVHDESLINDVGSRLAARCRSILKVNRAMRAKIVSCPGCQRDLSHDGAAECVIRCDACGWRTTWGAYRKTFSNKKLYAGSVDVTLREFVERFEAASSPQEKMIAIDRLIHTFHHQLTQNPTSPAAKNLIFGNVQEMVAFLNNLTHGDASTAQLRAMRAQYEQTLKRSWAGGVAPKRWDNSKE